MLAPTNQGHTAASPASSRQYSGLEVCSAGLLFSFVLAGCGSHTKEQRSGPADLSPVAVGIQAAEPVRWTMTEQAVGTVRAKLRAILEAKVSGRIEKLEVSVGQKVSAGELIARLQAPEIKARLEQAQASLEQAGRDWKRTSALFEQQALTRSEYESAESRYRLAQAALAEAQAMMGYVEIAAPFAGVVTRKWADVGDLAAPGKPLVAIEDPTELQLEADVPEAIISRVRPRASLAIQADALSGEFAGTVKEIAPVADADSRTFRVKLDLPTGTPLSPGQFARLLVPVGEKTSLFVPASAVVQRGQLELVFTMADQRARLHLVKTGKRTGQKVEILSGLDSGDAVIIDAAEVLLDGQLVVRK